MKNDITQKLKKALPEKRFIHSLGVAEEALRLAVLYGADTGKAYTAGLLHDCAKGIAADRQLEECDRRGLELDEWTRKCPPVIHGFLGAVIAEEEYGITDKEILNAIKYHTVGKAGMTLLDKIIYIADMTEINRDFDGVEKLRKAVEKNIDKAIMISIKQQLELNIARRSIIHPNIICLWNDLVFNKK